MKHDVSTRLCCCGCTLRLTLRGPVSNCSSFIPHVYSGPARFSKPIGGEKPRSVRLSLLTNTLRGGGWVGVEENAGTATDIKVVMDRGVRIHASSHLWCCVYSCLFISNWACQSKHSGNYNSHWDHKDIGQK